MTKLATTVTITGEDRCLPPSPTPDFEQRRVLAFTADITIPVFRSPFIHPLRWPQQACCGPLIHDLYLYVPPLPLVGTFLFLPWFYWFCIVFWIAWAGGHRKGTDKGREM